MKATLDQPICMATDLGLTPSSERMQVQEWPTSLTQEPAHKRNTVARQDDVPYTAPSEAFDEVVTEAYSPSHTLRDLFIDAPTHQGCYRFSGRVYSLSSPSFSKSSIA
jgi:hypothetical protein